MAKSKQIHTVHRPGGWGNIKAGGSKPAKLYSTKAKAVAVGRSTAKKIGAEQYIHNLNGQIGEKNSYGHDPRNIKG